MKKPRIAIIGANGYLGRHLTAACYAHQLEPHLYGSQATHRDNRQNYTQLDFYSDRKLSVFDPNVDLIFHFAGKTGTVDGFENYQSYLDLNDSFIIALLEKIRTAGTKPKVVFPSSRLVYKGQKNKPLVEGAEKEAKTMYAATKLASEQYLKMYTHIFGIPHSIVRICVPYGNDLDDSYSYGTIGSMLTQAKTNQKITLFGNGAQRRSLIHVSDLARIVLSVSLDKKTTNLTYNLGGPEQFSVKELAQHIAKKYHASLESVPWPTIYKKVESGDTIFDSSLIENLSVVTYEHRFKTWLNQL